MADIEAGDILIGIRGDASQLLDELEVARGGLEDFEGTAESTGESLGGIGRAAGKTNVAFKGLSRGGITGLAAGVSAVNPQMGKMLQTFGNLQFAVPRLARSIKALPAALGPVGIAAIAAASAYALLTSRTSALGKELDELEAKLEENDKRSSRVGEISDDLDTTLEGLQGRYDVLTGSVSKTDQELAAFNDTIDEQARAQIKLLGIEDSLLAADVQNRQGILTRAQNIKDLNEIISLEIEAQADAAEGAEQQAAADLEAADAARKRAEAEKARLGGIQAGMADIQADAATLNSEIDQGISELVGNLEGALAEIEAFMVRDQEAIEQGISNTLTGVSQLSATLAEQIAEDNSKAAMALFRTSQAAGLADVAINTAIAITKTLAQLGPIAGPVAAFGIGTLGAAQAAQIASQSPPEHLGTSDALMPDERMSFRRTQNQELTGPGGTVNSMGSSMVSDLNRGRFPSGGGAPVTAVIGRTHLDQELFKNGRRGTSRYSRQLRRNPHPKQNGGW